MLVKWYAQCNSFKESMVMTEEAPKPKMSARDKAEMIMKMTKEAERVARRTGAEACVVICVFRDGNQLIIQDAGKFVMPPPHLYNVMIQAHESGQLNTGPRSKLIKPH